MFFERKINESNKIELWKCEWQNSRGRPAKKVFIEKIGEEQPLKPDDDREWNKANAICWAFGRTIGNIAVFSQNVLGQFPEEAGKNATLPCDIVDAGKFRHGPSRWWCRTHQTYWGTKADHAAYERSKTVQCANHSQLMNYTLKPKEVNVTNFKEVGIWCSLPNALSDKPIEARAPKIHLHLRQELEGPKIVDNDFDAISLLYHQNLGLFKNQGITRVNITPPVALDFICALEEGRQMTCISCSRCGYPHLDLGDFSTTPHKKHFCGNCGWDSTWSKTPIVSTPLKPLHDQLASNLEYSLPKEEIDLSKYEGCSYDVWASTPAIVWTAKRPQATGIHVHVYKNKKRIVDDTFGKVIHDGKVLNRKEVFKLMLDKTLTK